MSRELSTGTETVLAANEQGDLDATVMINGQVEAVSFSPDRKHWMVIDPSVQRDFDALAKVDDGDFSIVSYDETHDTWLVEFVSDHHSDRYYKWDRAARKATLLFSTQPRLDAATFAPMKPITFRARDGMNIHAYLTLPVGLQPKNLPHVQLLQGGPCLHRTWGMDDESEGQWYANRGYAVLQVNYRGSSGYGKKYLHAGVRQWGRAMQDDLTDSVKWAVSEGIADPKRVAIVGLSYGGYAALAGAAFTPDVHQCSVDICGPSDLVADIKTHAAYHAAHATWISRVGDPSNPAGKELLTRASPLFSANGIRIPTLIGQGMNDPVVIRSQSDQIAAEIAKNSGHVTYVLYTDESHGFGRAANLLDSQHGKRSSSPTTSAAATNR